MKKKLYFAICFLLGIGTSASLLLDLDRQQIVFATIKNNDMFACFIVGIFFLWFYHKFLNSVKNNKIFQILSVILSLFLVVGYSYDVVGNASLVNGNVGLIICSIIKFISFYYMFNTSISLGYKKIISYRPKEIPPMSKLGDKFHKKPFLFSFIFIIVCYLPYFVAYFPGIISNDPLDQISEVMGNATKHTLAESIIYVDSDMTITNLNPVVHTLLLGGCYKLGYMINNENLGVLLYTIIQASIMISILAYSIHYMKKQGVPTKFLYIVLGIYAFVPVFPFYTVTALKDSLFSVFIILYIIKIYDLIKNEYTTRKYITLVLISILLILTRNNGLYTIVLSMPLLLIWLKGKRKQIILCLISIMAFNYIFFNVALPAAKVTSTSIREVLSIPFQQTARLAKYHDDKISEEDKKIIDHLLGYDTLAERYNPALSDAVKDRYNPNATSEDLKAYFEVWFKHLWKHPVVYVDATIANTYGFFYPNTTNWYIYYIRIARLDNPDFGYTYTYRYVDELKPVRTGLEHFGVIYPFIPVIGLFVNIGFVGWVYFTMFAMLLANKKREYITLLLPAFSLVLICVAGPANTYFRYALPYVFSLPLVACLLYGILDKNKTNDI